MIHGRDLLVFAPGPWDDIWRNRHQLLTILARENTVLWIEPRVFAGDALPQSGRAKLSWRRGIGPRVEQVRPGLYVYSDPVLPRAVTRRPLRDPIRRMRERSIRRVMSRLRMEAPVLWLFWPGQQDAIGRFGESLTIYHVVDEYSGYGGMGAEYREALRREEERLLRRADLVFVTSPALYESKRGYNPHTFLVPNGVNYAAFESVVQGKDEAPAIVAGVERPIVGYVGAMNAKIDLSLILGVAERRTDWTFLMVGPVLSEEPEDRRAYAGLRALSNVLFAGRVDVGQVPHYVNACDVCLMPYKINTWTRHVNSLKLFEYLACGKPIVGTDIPACRQVAPHVRIARGVEEFERHIEEALREDDPVLVRSRRALAARNTWEQRVESISQAIENRATEPGHAGYRE